MSQYPQPLYGQPSQPGPQGYMPQGGYPPSGYPQGGFAAPVGPTKTSGISIASLCCAVLLPGLGGLLGIILGVIGMKDASKPGKSGRGLAVAGLVVGIVNLLAVLLVVLIALPALNRVRAQANEIKTASNVRQTIVAIELYRSANGGSYPDSLAALVTAGFAKQEQIQCVESEQTFVYVKPMLPAGRSEVVSPYTLIIVYNPKGRLDSGALICGFADGHVEGFKESGADRMMSKLQSGSMRWP